MSSYVEYSSNNSGGDWWLDDDDWKALEAAGWVVQWVWLEKVYDDAGNSVYDDRGLPQLVPPGEGNSRYSFATKAVGERWLGALARAAFKPGAASLREAVDEWERITGERPTDAGCPCCGQPHSFTLYRNGKSVESGPHTSYEASW